MSDLKEAILDAKYFDMISLADFIVRDCGLPDSDDDGRMLPQVNEIAAALFRWAAGVEAAKGASVLAGVASARVLPDTDDDEYDEFGDPIMEAREAEDRLAADLSEAGDAIQAEVTKATDDVKAGKGNDSSTNNEADGSQKGDA